MAVVKAGYATQRQTPCLESLERKVFNICCADHVKYRYLSIVSTRYLGFYPWDEEWTNPDGTPESPPQDPNTMFGHMYFDGTYGPVFSAFLPPKQI